MSGSQYQILQSVAEVLNKRGMTPDKNRSIINEVIAQQTDIAVARLRDRLACDQARFLEVVLGDVENGQVRQYVVPNLRNGN